MTISWTLGDLMSHATYAIGKRSDIAASDVSFWVNEALGQVWELLPHNPQEKVTVSSTTSGGKYFALPTDFVEMQNISNISMTPPRMVPPTNIMLADSFSTSLGVPDKYILYNNWLEWVPSPDSTYSMQIRYRCLPTALSNTTDVPSIATRYRYPVMLKAAEMLAQNVIFDATKAAALGAQFASYMAALPSDRALRTRDQHYMGVSIPTWNNPVRQSRTTLVW